MRQNEFRDIETLLYLTEQWDDVRVQAEVALRQALYYEMLNEFADLDQAARRVVEAGQQLNDSSYQAAGYLMWGVRAGNRANSRMHGNELNMPLC